MGNCKTIDIVVNEALPSIAPEIQLIVMSYVDGDYELKNPLVKYGYDIQRTPQDHVEVPMYIMIGTSWDYCFTIPKVEAVGEAIQKYGVWKISEKQLADGITQRIVKNNAILQGIGQYVYHRGVDDKLLSWIAQLG